MSDHERLAASPAEAFDLPQQRGNRLSSHSQHQWRPQLATAQGEAQNLQVSPLTAEAFSDYGDVIETQDRPFISINEGLARRYFLLSTVEVVAGAPTISIVQTKGRNLSGPLTLMERHPGSTQTFIPLGDIRFIVVVSKDDLAPQSLRAFITDGRQGINYRRNVWHHALVALSDGEFLVVDGGGPAIPTEETLIADWSMMLHLPPEVT